MTELLSTLPEFQNIPVPFLMNALKHHAGALRGIIDRLALGEESLRELAGAVQVLGGSQMDMYTGSFSVEEVLAFVRQDMAMRSLHDRDAFLHALDQHKGFLVCVLPDQSEWVLYDAKVEDRYVHVHPARHSPCTVRLRGNAVKTAVLGVARALAYGHSPWDVTQLNAIRKTVLSLSPIPTIPKEGGLRTSIEMLLSVPLEVIA